MQDDLIERLEKATGPDRGLDADIASYVGWTPSPGYRRCSDNSWRRVIPGHTESDAINSVTWSPEFTCSIDAALTLVPEGFACEVRRYSSGNGLAKVWHKDGQRFAENGTTPTIALCITALKARVA